MRGVDMKNTKATTCLSLLAAAALALVSSVQAQTFVRPSVMDPSRILGLEGIRLSDSDCGCEDPRTVPCRRYARSAVALQVLNTSAGCGLTGEGWHPKYAEHLQWCLRQPNFVRAIVARAVRKAMLQSCTRTLEDLGCVWYAWEASLASEENQWLGCAYEGARWQTNFQIQLEWCEAQADYTDVVSEVQDRQQELSDCANSPP